MVRALVLDAIALRAVGANRRLRNGRWAGRLVLKMLRTLRPADVCLGPSPGRGIDLRLVGERIVGSGLLCEDRVVALFAFPADGAARPRLGR